MIHPARGAGHGSRARTVTSRTRARSPERAEPSFTDSHASPASARRDRRSRARLSPLHPSAVPTKGLAEDAHPIVRKSSTRLSGRALCPETRAVPARVARAHARSLVRSLAGAPVTHPRRTASASTTEPAAAPARTDQGFRDALYILCHRFFAYCGFGPNMRKARRFVQSFVRRLAVSKNQPSAGFFQGMF